MYVEGKLRTMAAFMECVLILFAICVYSAQATPLLYEKYHSPIQDVSTTEREQQALSRFVRQFSQSSSKYSWYGSVKGDAECTFCKVIVVIIQTLVAEGKTDEEIIGELVRSCIYLGIEDDRVCIAICHEFKNEFFKVVDKLVLEPSELCGTLFGSSCGKAYNPWEQWNVTLPDVPKPPVHPHVLPVPGSPTLRVLHISDIHYDSLYQPGANAECSEPMCCRPDDGPPGPGAVGAGQWGDYRFCDTPLSTLENLMQHLSSKAAEFDYIMWTGDLPAHNVWNQTRSDQLALIAKLTQMFKTYFPNKMIFSAVGNHESAPCNSFPPPFISDPEDSIAWLYNALADSWLNWLPEDTNSSIRLGAYYVVSPYPGLRIVTINTNFCNNMNWWVLLNTTDPGGQLAWLIEVLQDAENNKAKVHIIGHIPPGVTDCLKTWSWNYYKIVNRYESTIVGQFFGHTHYDEYEVFFDDTNLSRPSNVAYIVPSITPYHGLNSGYRIYTIDGNYSSSSWSVLDHETYIVNLTEANMPGNEPNWNLEYSAKAAYGLQSLFPDDWNQLIYRMKDNATLFQSFYNFFYKSHPDGQCDDRCRKKMLCRLKSGRSHDPELCFDI